MSMLFYNYFSFRYANYSTVCMCAVPDFTVNGYAMLQYSEREKKLVNSSLLFPVKSHPLMHFHNILLWKHFLQCSHLSMTYADKNYYRKLIFTLRNKNCAGISNVDEKRTKDSKILLNFPNS